jgi:hypothetical protein
MVKLINNILNPFPLNVFTIMNIHFSHVYPLYAKTNGLKYLFK